MDQAVFRAYLENVDACVETFGTIRHVYHDKREGDVHVDVYIIDADDPPRTILLTVGCAFVDRGSRVEPVEIALALPRSWPITEESLADPAVFWPFGWLRNLGTNLWKLLYGPLPGDLIRMPAGALTASKRFSALLGVPPEWIAPKLAAGFARPDGREVLVTGIVPIEDRERAWASALGEDAEDGSALLDLIEPDAIERVIVDVDRELFISDE